MPKAQTQDKIELQSRHYSDVSVRMDTFDQAERTIEVVWTTETPVRRYSYRMGGEFLEQLVVKEKNVRMQRFEAGMSLLDSHDNWSMNQRLGTVVPGTVRFSAGKAYATIKLSRKEQAEELFQDLVDGHPFPVSVGYRIHAYEKIPGTDDSIPTMRATDWEPMELSAVPIPADAGAHSRSEDSKDDHYTCIVFRNDDPAADAVNTQEENTMPKLNENASGGNGQDGISSERTAQIAADAVAAAAKKEAERREAEEATKREAEEAAKQKIADERRIAEEAVAADRKRNSGIRDLANRHSMDEAFVQKHIDGGSEIEDVRSAILDILAGKDDEVNTQPSVDTRNNQNEGDTRRAAVENALLARYDPSANEVMDSARQYMGLDLMGLARQFLREEGEKLDGLSIHEIAKRALHGNSDFPIILGNVANTVLRGAYEAYPNTFAPFCRRTSVTNFKDVYRAQMSEAPALKKVGENGEFTRGTLIEGKEGYRVETFGRIVGITRQALINDELDAFTRLPAAFGTQAAILEGNIVWGLILDNIAMADGNGLFHADHNNLGTAAALSSTALGDGRRSMRMQKGVDDQTVLNLRPSYLLLPTALEFQAEQIMKAQPSDDETKNVPGSLKSLTPIIEPRIDAISETMWMLAANPATIDTIEYAYLSGNEGLYTEQRVGFDVDGIEIKVRHDFGAGAIDWRGLYRNPGQ